MINNAAPSHGAPPPRGGQTARGARPTHSVPPLRGTPLPHAAPSSRGVPSPHRTPIPRDAPSSHPSQGPSPRIARSQGMKIILSIISSNKKLYLYNSDNISTKYKISLEIIESRLPYQIGSVIQNSGS